jgi:hypothetical protein
MMQVGQVDPEGLISLTESGALPLPASLHLNCLTYCGSDEIGRLPVLRSPGSKERVGSSPTFRTNI